jgi:hypothetical protein
LCSPRRVDRWQPRGAVTGTTRDGGFWMQWQKNIFQSLRYLWELACQR